MALRPAATASPNRIGPPGSACLVLLGVGLLALGWGRRAAVPYLGLAVCLINLVPAVGFLYGVAGFFSQARITGIAWPTVLALSALGLGLVVAQPDQGPVALLLRQDAGGTLLRRMLPAAILVPLVLGYLKREGESLGLYQAATGTGLLVTGQLRHRQVNAAPVRDAAGAIIGSVSVVRDITERKRAEEALRESEARLHVTLNSIGDAVLSVDTAGCVTFLNPVAVALTGWPLPEAVGQPIQKVFRIVDETSHQPGEDIVQRVLRERRVVALANHTVLVARDGREIAVEDSAAPIIDPNGKVAGVVLVFHLLS